MCSSDLHCKFCDREFGLHLSESAVQLWNYGVCWRKAGIQKNEDNEVSEEPHQHSALSDFKRIVFVGIHEFSFHLGCNILLQCVRTGDVIFLWSIDNNLPIYYTTSEMFTSTNGQDKTEKLVILEPRNAVKFFYYTIIGGTTSLLNEADKSMCSDHDLEVILPETVFKAGLVELKKISSLYATQDGSWNCAFLFPDDEKIDNK